MTLHILPYGVLIISFAYLLHIFFLSITRSLVASKADRTNWLLYNGLANFEISHTKLWVYLILFFSSIEYIYIYFIK